MSPKDKVDLLVDEVSFLVQQIKELDGLIESIKDEEAKQNYLVCMLDTIEEYKEINFKLRSALDEYFTYEKQQDIPRNLNYVRLYRALKI